MTPRTCWWHLLLVVATVILQPLRADDAPAAPVTDPARISAQYHEVLTHDQYREIAEPPVNTRIEDWLSQWFKSLGARFGEFRYASRMPAFESLLMTLLVAFAIGILLYIMVRLTRRRGRMKLDRADEVADPKAFLAPEDYDREIVVALQAADWHAAYLAAWRQFLSRLEHRHLVDNDRTRTNREYLAQLRGKSLPGSADKLLTGLVDAYDRFIYGRQSIAETDWATFRAQLNETALILHLEDKIKPAGGATP
jgi:Domain of unknown function (DUF4129)